MEYSNRIALVVAYYLSKFDLDGLKNLGYTSWTQAYKDVGSKLSVKDTTVNNMRDEFDSVNDNARAGWHQRELRPSRINVIEKFQDLSEEAYREIVTELLSEDQSDDVKDIIDMLDESDEKKAKRGTTFTTRAKTGRKAEELFITYFNNGNFPKEGELIDTRELGCGYDFIVKANDDLEYYVEVKGRVEESGGILFTDKEWKVAKQEKENFFLVIISNVDGEKSVIYKIINNPANKLKAQKNVYTTVQVNWSVSTIDL